MEVEEEVLEGGAPRADVCQPPPGLLASFPRGCGGVCAGGGSGWGGHQMDVPVRRRYLFAAGLRLTGCQPALITGIHHPAAEPFSHPPPPAV